MASTYSSNLKIELIGNGDQAGTWGTTTNKNLGTLIEEAISGYISVAVSTGATTTITIPDGASTPPLGIARNMYLVLIGTGGTNTYLEVPTNKKLYFIHNSTAGAVTVRVAGQTGVSVSAGDKLILVCNGTDIVKAVEYVSSLNSGTTNYVTKFINSYTLGDSLIYDNGTNVAIGGNTPNSTSRVSIAVNGATNSAIAFQDTNTSGRTWVTGPGVGSGSALDFGFYDSTGAMNASTYTAGASGKWVWYTNNTERMRIDSAGNVGVGTGASTLYATLSVQQTSATLNAPLTITSSIAAASGTVIAGFGARDQFVLQDNAGNQINTNSIRSEWVNPTTGTRSAKLVITSATGNAQTDALVIDPSGNIGVGNTPSGTYKLEVTGAIGATGVVSGASVSATGAVSGASVSATGAVSGASVSATGAVSGASVSATGAVSGASVSATGAVSGATLIPTGATAPTNGVYLPSANTLAIATNSTRRLTISSSGNVGIGVSLPTTKLDVAGGIKTDTGISATGAGLGTTYLDDYPATLVSIASSEGAYSTMFLNGSAGAYYGLGVLIYDSGVTGINVGDGTSNTVNMASFDPSSGEFSFGNSFIKHVTGASAVGLRNSASSLWGDTLTALQVGAKTSLVYDPSGAGVTRLSTNIIKDSSGTYPLINTAQNPLMYVQDPNTSGAIRGKHSFLGGYNDGNDYAFFWNLLSAARTGDFDYAYKIVFGDETGSTENYAKIECDSSTYNRFVLTGCSNYPGYATIANNGGNVGFTLDATNGGYDCQMIMNLGGSYSDGYYVRFKLDSVQKGGIYFNGGGVTYATTSDYRLKDNPQPLTNSGAFIDALSPRKWTWKDTGTQGVGFIAHELQAVSPSSVQGEKDAVDDEGRPDLQAVGYGSPEIIANIIAELKALRLRVAELESK